MPQGSLVNVGDTLYGVTISGTSDNSGSIFRIKTDGTGYTVLFQFNNATGKEPSSIILREKTLFGMTVNSIYRIGIDANNYKKLLDFNFSNGWWPYSCYLSIADTMLYGMTQGGGLNSNGVAFRLDINGNNYQKLYEFESSYGTYPSGSLIVSGKTLYGVTTYGGSYDKGVLFKLVLCKDTIINRDTAIAKNGQCKLPDGTIITDSGTYINSFTSHFGCDSTIVTNVITLNCNDTSVQIDTSIAGNVSYILPGGEIVYLPGIYTDTLKSMNGCDSIIISNVKFLCRDTILLVDASMAKDGTFTLPGGEIVNTAGIYIDTLISINGCDSVIITNLSIRTNLSDNNKINTISIYPNPAKEYIVINTNLNKYNISIVNITGKILINKDFNNGSIKLNITDLNEGVYFIRVNCESGSKIFKFIKLIDPDY